MGIAVVGTSNIADEFVLACRGAGVDVRAVYSRKKETGRSFAERHDIPLVVTDFDALCSGDFDCIYVATPNLFHFDQSKRLLESGVSVFCEKPITVTAEQYLQLRGIADGKGLFYDCAMMSAHSPGLDVIRRSIPRIGKITGAHLIFFQRSSRLDRLYSGELPNIFNMELQAGALMDLGVYNIYAALELFGKPLSADSKTSFHSCGCDYSGSAIFDYGDFHAVLSWNKFADSPAPSVITGENGWISISSVSQFRGIRLHTKDSDCELYSDDVSKVGIMAYEASYMKSMLMLASEERLKNAVYSEMKDCTLSAAEIMDGIRKSNGFPF
ncbi:MAG: Gfo/Idh/MocA family oxidoreductase [Clostridia bacterium]|nr:Gfo/Idh/MocA family oxidoreductase [Clostridia bacterium]